MKKKLFKSFAIFFGALALIITTTAFTFKSDFFEIAKQLEIFTTLFKELDMNYVDQTNPAELMDTAIKAMLTDLDPYTNYWNEQEVQEARINATGEYQGIGAAVQIKADRFIIMEVYKDFPADKAGLKPGDEIIKIGGLNVSDYKENAGDLLNGSPNSKISITYIRQGKTQTTTLTRGTVELHAVPFYKMLDNNIGYIVLSKFNDKASEETAHALKELQNKGATKIILDLRGNPGGLLSEAILVSNIFLNKDQLIVSTKSSVEKYNKEYYTPKEPINTHIPLAVLVNGHSASASEIVAGSIQDLDRGVIVGARSFGKGLVQRPEELPYGTQLKLTISRYYTPSGRCIQALNYRQRDAEGNPVRTKTEDYNEFKTKNGRSVYDGGGILPDVKLKSSEYNTISKALLSSDAIFDFATKYYYSHGLDNPESFKLTDADYNNFKDFLESTKFSYETRTEIDLKNAMETAQKEGFDSKIIDKYKTILADIQQEKKQELDDKKPEIASLLTDEILRRYFYQEGLYKHYVLNNPEILAAEKVLNDPLEYKKILKD